MTRGRYFWADPSAPCVPSATYLASREFYINKEELPYGEWGGAQPVDMGLPPHLLPQNQPIGGTCLENLRPSPSDDDEEGVNRGRCIHLPTRELCGNVPLFANFSLAYDIGVINYYRNVRNYVTKDDGEGEWSGAVDDLADAVTRVRVTESDGGELDFRFAICDNSPPPPPVLPCCSGAFPYRFKRSLKIQAEEIPSTPLWEVDVGDIEFVWLPDDLIFTAVFECGGVTYEADAFIYEGSGCKAGIDIHEQASGAGVYFASACVVTCPPGTWADGPPMPLDIGTVINFCGETVTGGIPTKRMKAVWGPVH